MNRTRSVLLMAAAAICWIVLLSGCDSQVSGADQFSAACRENTNIPDEACQCLANRAETELSEPAAVWLATAMRGEKERALQLKESVPWTELLEASMFMMKAGEACAVDEEGLPIIE